MLKKFLILLLGLALVALLIVYFAWGPVMERLAQTTLREIAAKGNNLGWKGLRVRGTSVQIDSIEGWVPLYVKRSPFPIPIPFALEKLTASVPILTALTGSPVGAFSFGAYGGQIEGTVTTPTGNPSLIATVKGVQLHQHPTIQGFGVSSGVLAASTTGLRFNKDSPPIGDFQLQLSRLAIPQLPIAVTQIPIPALDNVLFEILGALSSEGNLTTIKITKAVLESPLLKAEGFMNAVAPQFGGRGSCEATISIALSEQGVSVLGSAVTLGSALVNTPLPAGTRTFRIQATGAPLARGCELPRVPIGPFCMTAHFTRVD